MIKNQNNNFQRNQCGQKWRFPGNRIAWEDVSFPQVWFVVETLGKHQAFVALTWFIKKNILKFCHNSGCFSVWESFGTSKWFPSFTEETGLQPRISSICFRYTGILDTVQFYCFYNFCLSRESGSSSHLSARGVSTTWSTIWSAVLSLEALSLRWNTI